MYKLFNEIRTNTKWVPSTNKNYNFVDIHKLKKMADTRFDKMAYKGDFFYDYNDVLYRIETLNKHICST